MAPAGNFECLHAAIQGGADSVYFGIGNLNMRSHSANNFAAEDLQEVCDICRANGIKPYLTLNITLYNEDLGPMREALQAAEKAGVSAVIASDMAAIAYARSLGIEVHISTQLSISNSESLRFYAQFADVIVLARELTLVQVREIHEIILRDNIKGPSGRLLEIEMFCHGALCMAVSGKCYLSLHEYGASANRGSCYQICRRGYEVTDLETGNQLLVDNKYIMSPKDLCTIEFMDKIIEAGVTVFNRGFWDGYYQGARLGEWSEIYGNKATRTKKYIGKITNYFDKIGVAEVLIETGSLSVGDPVIISGPSTGVVEFEIPEIRVDLKPVQTASKGELCSIPVAEKLRRSDRIYLFE
ncbi:MAG: U32 family peptidase [Bacteroidales bacterium]|nr:U32 family peptidase [Candidatus Equibacterium intestinale]